MLETVATMDRFLHAERLRGYLELTGVRALAFNFQKWDSPAALNACASLARRSRTRRVAAETCSLSALAIVGASSGRRG